MQIVDKKSDDETKTKRRQRRNKFRLVFFCKQKKVIVMAVAVDYKEKLKNKDLDVFFRNADDQNAEEAMS